MQHAYGPALDNDTRAAYLFRCGDTDLYAISLDPQGRNIPVADCKYTWRLEASFRLGVHEPVPIAIDPEPILRGISAEGYFVCRQANTSKPHGTSQ
jgi:hypothetical protein